MVDGRMAWTYSDWISRTGTDRLTRLRLHIQEVSDAITAATDSNGETYNPQVLQTYLDGLMRREGQISAAAGGAGGMFSVPTRRQE